jgi:AAA+ superfamily predicted ATPase
MTFLCLVCIQVVSSAIVDKYIGESARLIREMFNYARDHQPCIIFMDEIDAIGVYVRFLVKLRLPFNFNHIVLHVGHIFTDLP